MQDVLIKEIRNYLKRGSSCKCSPISIVFSQPLQCTEFGDLRDSAELIAGDQNRVPPAGRAVPRETSRGGPYLLGSSLIRGGVRRLPLKLLGLRFAPNLHKSKSIFPKLSMQGLNRTVKPLESPPSRVDLLGTASSVRTAGV